MSERFIDELTPEEYVVVRAEFDRICNSVLADAPVQQKLLRYLVEKTRTLRDEERIKEYVIGLDVFGKDQSFDPAQDSGVRVNVRILRTKLDNFYCETKSSFRLQIPLRQFRVSIVGTVPAQAQPPQPIETDDQTTTTSAAGRGDAHGLEDRELKTEPPPADPDSRGPAAQTDKKRSHPFKAVGIAGLLAGAVAMLAYALAHNWFWPESGLQRPGAIDRYSLGWVKLVDLESDAPASFRPDPGMHNVRAELFLKDNAVRSSEIHLRFSRRQEFRQHPVL